MSLTPLQPWIAARLADRAVPLTRARLAAYQLDKLRETIAWAQARSAFYRRHLTGLSAADLVQLGDFAQYPFTTAEHLRCNPLAFLCVSQGEVSRVVTLQTSGTSGDPKRIYFSEADQELTVDFFHHGMSVLTEPGDRVLILLPGGRPGGVADLLRTGLNRLGARGIHHGPVVDIERTLQVLAAERAAVLVGIPAQVLALARSSRSARVPVQRVLLSTDHVPRAVAAEIERRWNCEVYSHYGMTEMGFGGGVQCRQRHGYHMREADLYFEIIDPESGAVLPDGQSGEVVFTTLTRTAMPLIRYRTGDVTRFLPEPCACGTVLRAMAPVKGRITGRLELAAGGTLTLADLDEAIFAVPDVIDFEASLTRCGKRDCLCVKVVFKSVVGTAAEAAINEVLHSIPALRRALALEQLTTSVTTVPGGGRCRRLTSKRVLADLRGESSK